MQTLVVCDWLNVGQPYPVIITSPRESSYGHEYTVTWAKPVDGGLPISSYEIKYRQVRGSYLSLPISSYEIKFRQVCGSYLSLPISSYEIKYRQVRGWFLPLTSNQLL